MFCHSNRNVNEDKFVSETGYCCDRAEQIVFGRIVEGLWTFERGKLLGIRSSAECSVRAWQITRLKKEQPVKAWLVKFQREAKILRGRLCGESMVLVSWSLSIGCDYQKTRTEPLLCLSAGATKLAVIRRNQHRWGWLFWEVFSQSQNIYLILFYLAKIQGQLWFYFEPKDCSITKKSMQLRNAESRRNRFPRGSTHHWVAQYPTVSREDILTVTLYRLGRLRWGMVIHEVCSNN